MILKNRITMIAGAMFLAMVALAQDNKAFEAEYASTKNQWLAESEYLREYEGVDRYCQNVEYRETVDGILVSMHHLDSLIMQRVNDPTLALSMDYKEQKKTLKDISKLETEYSTKDFVEQMRNTCKCRNEIEEEAELLKNGIGADSYDARVLVLETEIQRYLNHIDKLAVKIDDHLHYLYIVE